MGLSPFLLFENFGKRSEVVDVGLDALYYFVFEDELIGSVRARRLAYAHLQ